MMTKMETRKGELSYLPGVTKKISKENEERQIGLGWEIPRKRAGRRGGAGGEGGRGGGLGEEGWSFVRD